MPPSRVLVAVAFAAVYVFWGSTYLAIRVAVLAMPPFLMAGAILYAIVRARGVAKPERRQWLAAAGVGGLLLLGGNGGVVWAEQFVPSGLAALLVASVPLWIAVFEAARGVRPTWIQGAGLLAGFAGVAVLMATGGDGRPVHLGGALALVVATVSWAAGSLYARTAPLPKSPLLAIAMEMLAGGGLQLATGLALGEAGRLDLASVPAKAWAAVAYLVVFGSLGGFVAYVWLLGVRPAAQVATYAYVNPVIAVLLGWALLDEPLTWRMAASAAVIVASVAALTLGRRGPK